MLKSIFRMLYKNRRILYSVTKDDIRKKYAGSTLGTLWLLLYPLLFLAMYSFVYAIVLQIRVGVMTTEQYIMLIFSGLLPFFGFSETLSNSVMSVTANASLVKNTLVPIDIMPVKAVLFSQCTQIVGTGYLLIAMMYFGTVSKYTVLLIPIWVCQILFNTGVAWFLSALNVYIRDIQTIIPLISMLLMFSSPIAYTVDMVPNSLRFVMNFNPLFYFVTAYQDVMIVGCFPRENVLIYILVLTTCMFFFGYWFFSKVKQVLADNI